MIDSGSAYAAQAAQQFEQPEAHKARLMRARDDLLREVRRLEGTIAGIDAAIKLIENRVT